MIRALDLFAGPGGFDLGARALGIDPLGIETDAAVCATRAAAGLRTERCDVADQSPHAFGPTELLIGSPPCPSFSQANDDRPTDDVAIVTEAIRGMVEGSTYSLAYHADRCDDPRSILTAEPLRWALALHPRWIACEQVPPVLPIWRAMAAALDEAGYATWCGILEAERYGCPQTRERAFLLAEFEAPAVHPPPVTHQRYVPGHGAQAELTFEGELLPWVSMAEALGWGMTERPAPTVAGAGTSGGGPRPLDGGSGARQLVKRERDAGRWRLRNGNQPNATERNTDEPAPTIAFGHNAARAEWTHVVDTGNTRSGSRREGRVRRADQPAPTITTRADQLEAREGAIDWTRVRPATTVQGDSRIWPPGHKQNAIDSAAGRDYYGDRAGTEAIRVEPHEAAILQGFPPDYPWRGSRTQVFSQIGNAVPPPLARAVLAELVGDQAPARTAPAEVAA